MRVQSGEAECVYKETLNLGVQELMLYLFNNHIWRFAFYH